MDRESLLLLNTATIVGYAVVGHLLRKLAGLRSSYHLFHYIAPALVVTVMHVILRFMPGVTKVQVAAGDDGAMRLVDLWWFLWLWFLFGLPWVGAGQLAWSICSLFRKERLLLTPLSFLGVCLLCQTLYTVAMHYSGA